MRFTKFIMVLVLLPIILSPIFFGYTEAQCESKNLSENIYNQSRPRVAVDEDVVHVVWEDNSQGSNIIYSRSTDGGNTWASPITITNNPAYQQNPDIAAYEENVYVVWEDKRNFDKNGSDI